MCKLLLNKLVRMISRRKLRTLEESKVLWIHPMSSLIRKTHGRSPLAPQGRTGSQKHGHQELEEDESSHSATEWTIKSSDWEGAAWRREGSGGSSPSSYELEVIWLDVAEGLYDVSNHELCLLLGWLRRSAPEKHH
jgi:hypothetical protein